MVRTLQTLQWGCAALLLDTPRKTDMIINVGEKEVIVSISCIGRHSITTSKVDDCNWQCQRHVRLVFQMQLHV